MVDILVEIRVPLLFGLSRYGLRHHQKGWFELRSSEIQITSECRLGMRQYVLSRKGSSRSCKEANRRHATEDLPT